MTSPEHYKIPRDIVRKAAVGASAALLIGFGATSLFLGGSTYGNVNYLRYGVTDQVKAAQGQAQQAGKLVDSLIAPACGKFKIESVSGTNGGLPLVVQCSDKSKRTVVVSGR